MAWPSRAKVSRSSATRATGASWKATATCAGAAGAAPPLAWVPEAFLLAEGIAPYKDMPLWVPRANAGFATTSHGRAVSAGLTHRPIARTARDTLAWDATRDQSVPMKNGISMEREQALLAAFRALSVQV